MTVEEMNQRKKELGYTNAMISELSGVPLTTVQKVLSGTTRSPRYRTLSELETVLRDSGDASAKRISTVPSSPIRYDGVIREMEGQAHPSTVADTPATFKINKPGNHTIEDYYALPDDPRTELIDGSFYVMEAPSIIHQMIVAKLTYVLSSYIESESGSCLALPSPLDVQLDCDDRTMVQPDVVVVCDRSKVKRKVIYGAPDLVIEVSSPSSRRMDMARKLEKYEHAGVREYWIIDPEKERVMVYDFMGGDLLTIYGMDSVVPVRIFDGKCTVDFRKIYEYIKFLYEEEEYG